MKYAIQMVRICMDRVVDDVFWPERGESFLIEIAMRTHLLKSSPHHHHYRHHHLSLQSWLGAGLHLHKSARYVLDWGCEEVFRWLATNNFGQYQVYSYFAVYC